MCVFSCPVRVSLTSRQACWVGPAANKPFWLLRWENCPNVRTAPVHTQERRRGSSLHIFFKTTSRCDGQQPFEHHAKSMSGTTLTLQVLISRHAAGCDRFSRNQYGLFDKFFKTGRKTFCSDDGFKVQSKLSLFFEKLLVFE